MISIDSVRRVLDEIVDDTKRLGRHILHDPLSWNWPAPRAEIATVLHARYVPVYDQGDNGSCTGMAAAGACMTAPLWRANEQPLNEDDALDLYARATHIDSFRGVWPPNDTGSSGLAVARAAKERGLIGAYRHAFGLQHALEALTVAPVITGITWYDSFDVPDPDGMVSISPNAEPRGGHEFEVLGLDADARTIRCVNSWGDGWGDGGAFSMSWATWDWLLHDDGDVTQLHR